MDRAVVVRMADAIKHRGPDDSGFYFAPRIGLGFRRLSIIDLAGGHQPMSNERGDVWVVFNGEVYNYRELRRELSGLGHRFATESDTEAVVHGYEEWGDEVLSHLEGMFGLCVWDATHDRVVLARDRLGIKPLYYFTDKNMLCFGSEIKALRAAGYGTAGVDAEAVYLFLKYRYTPSPMTVYAGLRKLGAGTKLVAERGQTHVSVWWDSRPGVVESGRSWGQEADILLGLYKDAVESHLVSDVPVGLLLSGGVDSALLLALMNRYGRDWGTYTVGYGAEYAGDELDLSARSASLLSARNYGVRLDRTAFERSLAAVVRSLEEPIASASTVPMYHVCEVARRDVKVAFMGQGPDELFGGYRRHIGVAYGSLWRRLPRSVRNTVRNAALHIPRAEGLKRGIRSLGEPNRYRRYAAVLALEEDAVVSGLFRDGLLPDGVDDGLLQCWSDLIPLSVGLDELGGFQFFELRSTLPDELLMYADKLSMAHGLEVRVPYLDRRVVQFAENLRAAYKVKCAKGKRLHREVCRRLLPREIMRRPKRGFAADVVDEWFRDDLTSKMTDYLTSKDALMLDYLDAAAVETVLDEHRNRQHNHYKLLFSLCVFEEWLRGQ